MKIVENLKGEKLVISPKLTLRDENKALVTHCINLFLEIFGKCEVVDEKLDTIITSKSLKLNWNLLPQGQYPWSSIGRRFSKQLILEEREIPLLLKAGWNL